VIGVSDILENPSVSTCLISQMTVHPLRSAPRLWGNQPAARRCPHFARLLSSRFRDDDSGVWDGRCPGPRRWGPVEDDPSVTRGRAPAKPGRTRVGKPMSIPHPIVAGGPGPRRRRARASSSGVSPRPAYARGSAEIHHSHGFAKGVRLRITAAGKKFESHNITRGGKARATKQPA